MPCVSCRHPFPSSEDFGPYAPSAISGVCVSCLARDLDVEHYVQCYPVLSETYVPAVATLRDGRRVSFALDAEDADWEVELIVRDPAIETVDVADARTVRDLRVREFYGPGGWVLADYLPEDERRAVRELRERRRDGRVSAGTSLLDLTPRELVRELAEVRAVETDARLASEAIDREERFRDDY